MGSAQSLVDPTSLEKAYSSSSNDYEYLLATKVIMYSKPYLQGNAYALAAGNYTSEKFIPQISPDNVFSMSVPAKTTVKLFNGNIYDYGNKGFMHIVNTSQETIPVSTLPQNMQGSVKSVSISNDINDIIDIIDRGALAATSSTTSVKANQPIEQFYDYTVTDHNISIIWYVLVGLIVICIVMKLIENKN